MASAQRRTKAPSLPTLENGDRLTVAEFERRYCAMPHVKKAELIEGRVYMPSPVPIPFHGLPHAQLMTWLTLYAVDTPGVQPSDNSTVKLVKGRNRPQPDALLRIHEDRGGQSSLDEQGYLRGAPELAAEIAASSVSYDLHEKLSAYERNGVREYVVWRIYDGKVDWFALKGTKYSRLKPGTDRIYRSKIFPGLWLDARALVGEDIRRVFDVLREGLASAEHQRFVEQLQASNE